MKLKYKKQNSPRMQSAINRTFHSWIGYCIWSDVRGLGMLALDLAYGADKYDVLNALCPGIQGEVITYARGDIRHRKHRFGCDSIATYTTLLLLVVVVALLSGAW